jgi:uncharacterized protein YdaU (DUF1376 family)
VNFVKLYIGDYMRKTGSLTVAEHGAYVLMLLHYYGTEQPLPTGRELHRLLRAETRADREAIDSIAARFWSVTESGLINRRADEEIAKAEHQRDVNRVVGKLGGRPKRMQTESVSESVTEPEPNHNPNHSQTPDNTPPLPTAVAPPRPARATRKCPKDFAVTDDMRRWALREVPGLRTLDAEHAKFADHTFRTAISDWPAAWRNWMRKAQEFAAAKRPANGSAEPAWRTEQRERNEAFLGPAAARRTLATVIDLEAHDAATLRLG